MKKDPIKLMDFEFLRKYKPVLNENGELARFDSLPPGIAPQNVWTMNESENSYYIANGVHPVDFIAFVVTEVPCAEDETVVVAWDVRANEEEGFWGVECPACGSRSSLTATESQTVSLKQDGDSVVVGDLEIDEGSGLSCKCGCTFSWDDGRAAHNKAQADADELALADFLYDDSDWRLAVANDDTRLGRNEWKVAQVHERMNEDE